jgi:hypothetical protein
MKQAKTIFIFQVWNQNKGLAANMTGDLFYWQEWAASVSSELREAGFSQLSARFICESTNVL